MQGLATSSSTGGPSGGPRASTAEAMFGPGGGWQGGLMSQGIASNYGPANMSTMGAGSVYGPPAAYGAGPSSGGGWHGAGGAYARYVLMVRCGTHAERCGTACGASFLKSLMQCAV